MVKMKFSNIFMSYTIFFFMYKFLFYFFVYVPRYKGYFILFFYTMINDKMGRTSVFSHKSAPNYIISNNAL